MLANRGDSGHSRHQIAPDQTECLATPNLLFERVHQTFMVDRIEERFQVAFHGVASSFLPALLHHDHRLKG